MRGILKCLGRGVVCWAAIGAFAGTVMGGAMASETASTDPAPAPVAAAPAAGSYESFKVIVDKNIFDPTRGPRRAASENRSASERPVRTESFTLRGTLIDQDRAVAFFEGSDAQYKALKPSDMIAGFKIIEITPNSVRLEQGGKTIEWAMLRQLKRKNDEPWELSEQPVQSAAADSTPKASGEGGSSVMDEVLKRLKQRREKEL